MQCAMVKKAIRPWNVIFVGSSPTPETRDCPAYGFDNIDYLGNDLSFADGIASSKECGNWKVFLNS